MSICAVPPAASTTDYTTPGYYVDNPPNPLFEMCGAGASTSTISGPGASVTTTICCPSPGPAGPAGCAFSWAGNWISGTTYHFESGTPCTTSIVGHNGVSYICKLTHTAGTTTEPGVGGTWTSDWDIFAQTSQELHWAGTWTNGTTYKTNDVVLGPKQGLAWVCVADHTSNDDEPTIVHTSDDGIFGSGITTTTYTNANWENMVDFSKTMDPSQQGFLDGLMNGVTDWWKDASLLNKVLAIAAGIGLVYAGSKILDMMSGSGAGDPGSPADSQYTGSAGYDGTYTVPTLPVVVATIMEFAGYTSGHYDVSMLPNKEVNFSVTGGMNTRALLNQLALTYQFDIVPSEGMVKFVPKYQAPIRALTIDDLGHAVMSDSSLSGPADYTAKRLQGIDLPRSVQFSYFSAALDQNLFTQQATLHTFEEGQDTVIQVPFTLSEAEAMRIAESTLVNAHIEQQEFVFTTDYHNIDLEPGDVITIPVGSDGDIAQVRIKEVNEVDDGLLEFRTSRADYNTESYLSSGVTVAVPPAQPTNVPTVVGYSDTLFIEVPPLNSNDATPRLYGIVHGYNAPGWRGANIYKSIDGGNTYSLLASSSAQCTMGLVASAVSAPLNGYYTWDDTTTIQVVLKQGTLNNLTDIAVLNGANWCMIGEEVIGFVNATLTAPMTYTLSRLMRGRQGSEVKCGSHLANELFVMLDNNLTRIEYPVDQVAQTVKYKTVSIGSSIDKVTAVDVQPYALNMRPWAPGHTTIVKNGSDFVITWKERPRLNNSLRDLTEITHDADWAGFGITIFSDNTATVIKRTAIAVENTFTYTAAMQTTDFGSVQTTLKASVVQMGKTTGGGYPAVVSI